jgi:putative transposase
MKRLTDRKTIRLHGWDYRKNGAYFVTICTSDRDHYFGKITIGIMHLSEIGMIARDCWQEIPQHFQFVNLDAYTIMPDHMHGIMVINKHRGALETPVDDRMSIISPKPGSLSTIIRSYKSAVPNRAHQINPDFAWQSRFYDHIIRNPQSKDRIARYIKNNAENWQRIGHGLF